MDDKKLILKVEDVSYKIGKSPDDSYAQVDCEFIINGIKGRKYYFIANQDNKSEKELINIAKTRFDKDFKCGVFDKYGIEPKINEKENKFIEEYKMPKNKIDRAFYKKEKRKNVSGRGKGIIIGACCILALGGLTTGGLFLAKTIIEKSQQKEASNEVTLTFDAGNGKFEGIDTSDTKISKKVKKGTKLSEIEKPSVIGKSNFSLNYWTLNGNDPIKDDYVINSSIIVKAKYNTPKEESAIVVDASSVSNLGLSIDGDSTLKLDGQNHTFNIKKSESSVCTLYEASQITEDVLSNFKASVTKAGESFVELKASYNSSSKLIEMKTTELNSSPIFTFDVVKENTNEEKQAKINFIYDAFASSFPKYKEDKIGVKIEKFKLYLPPYEKGVLKLNGNGAVLFGTDPSSITSPSYVGEIDYKSVDDDPDNPDNYINLYIKPNDGYLFNNDYNVDNYSVTLTPPYQSSLDPMSILEFNQYGGEVNFIANQSSATKEKLLYCKINLIALKNTFTFEEKPGGCDIQIECNLGKNGLVYDLNGSGYISYGDSSSAQASYGSISGFNNDYLTFAPSSGYKLFGDQFNDMMEDPSMAKFTILKNGEELESFAFNDCYNYGFLSNVMEEYGELVIILNYGSISNYCEEYFGFSIDDENASIKISVNFPQVAFSGSMSSQTGKFYDEEGQELQQCTFDLNPESNTKIIAKNVDHYALYEDKDEMLSSCVFTFGQDELTLEDLVNEELVDSDGYGFIDIGGDPSNKGVYITFNDANLIEYMSNKGISSFNGSVAFNYSISLSTNNTGKFLAEDLTTEVNPVAIIKPGSTLVIRAIPDSSHVMFNDVSFLSDPDFVNMIIDGEVVGLDNLSEFLTESPSIQTEGTVTYVKISLNCDAILEASYSIDFQTINVIFLEPGF